MTPQPSEQPRTAAGRALLDSLPLNEWHPINREIVIDHILAIEAEAAAPDPVATPPESFADALTEHSKERHHPEYGCRTTCAPDILARLPEVPALVGRTDEHMEALRE